MEGETDTFIPSTNPITQTSYLSDDHEYAKSRSDSDQRSEFLPEKEIAGSGSHRLETMMSTKYKVFRTLCIILGHVGMVRSSRYFETMLYNALDYQIISGIRSTCKLHRPILQDQWTTVYVVLCIGGDVGEVLGEYKGTWKSMSNRGGLRIE